MLIESSRDSNDFIRGPKDGKKTGRQLNWVTADLAWLREGRQRVPFRNFIKSDDIRSWMLVQNIQRVYKPFTGRRAVLKTSHFGVFCKNEPKVGSRAWLSANTSPSRKHTSVYTSECDDAINYNLDKILARAERSSICGVNGKRGKILFQASSSEWLKCSQGRWRLRLFTRPSPCCL